MALLIRYYSPETPDADGWTEDITTVRIADIAGVITEAQLGSVGESSLPMDDINADVGHEGDAILGLKQIAITETAAPVGRRRIWTGYTGDRRYSRGDDESMILDDSRRIDATLVDINAFLSFRVFTSEDIDETSSFNRPAETDVARITALLAVDFLSDTLFDGLVATAHPVAMDAVDYKGQRPNDVLNDCAQQSGKNFFVFYDEAGDYTPDPGDFGLFYDSNNSDVYMSTMRVSNVAADVDNSVTFAPGTTAVVTRDPSRVVAGVLLDYDGGTTYRSRPATAVVYGWRDGTVSAPNVKTLAKANARADRYLLENSTEDETITFPVWLPRVNVNDWREGEAGEIKLSHEPGYEDFRLVRCLKRTVRQDVDEPATHYMVDYECTPISTTSGEAQGAFDNFVSTRADSARPTLLAETTPGRLLLAVVSTQGQSPESSISAGDLVYFDDGSVTPSSAWAILAQPQEHNGGQNIGPPGAVQFTWAYRFVGPAERTTQPVKIIPTTTAHTLGVWLWELPTTTAPVLHESVNGALDYPGTNSIGTSTAGFVFGGFVLTTLDYGSTPSIVPVTGTEVQNCDSRNNTAAADLNGDPARHATPWVYLGQSDVGDPIAGAVSGLVAGPTAYTTVGYVGVTVILDGITSIPTIPYPANQV